MAQVTGGITPVYAAPETFDGIITRFCDQYSLACVYQELLTGVRPFDGCSISQLLMQHLNLPPNLEPSPPCDRTALARALAKKPEDRWPNVLGFVRALLGTTISGRVAVPIPRAPAPAESPPPVVHEDLPQTVPAPLSPPPGAQSPPSASADTPPPRAVTETTGPVFTPAPPETSGPGPLLPALVI